MADAGVELDVEMTSHSVVGILEVFRHLLTFIRIFNQLFRLAIEREPQAIVCVDFPGFNRRFAHAIKAHVRARRGPFFDWNPKLVHYVSPQVWASRERRALQMVRDLDLLLSIFPFEKDWYASRFPAFNVQFVGHPMLDRYPARRSENRRAEAPATPMGGFPKGPLVVLLPGSRKAELERHLPVMLEAWQMIKKVRPAARAVIVSPDATLAAIARGFWPTGVDIQVGRLADALSEATLAIASTGTVTMECAYFGVPAVTLYKTSWFTYQIARRLAKVKWATMPNLLANAEIFPEFLQDTATAQNIGQATIELLGDENRRAGVKATLAEIVSSLGGPGANRRAAEAVLKFVHDGHARPG
jgi:lipid-A-disaccharide synthase